MDVPTLVSAALGDEGVAARVPLNGENALFVTKTRTIKYAEEGLLSDESVDEFPHDAERVVLKEGRRKATIELDYGTAGTRSFVVPSSHVESALHPVLAGVLNANGVTGPGETVKRTFRFSELTLVVTSHRLVKHVGAAVWDEEFEEVPYEAVTGIEVEEGNVASQYVLSTPDQTQRIKAPNEAFREVRESIEGAILAYHDVDSVAAFEALVQEDEDVETTAAGPEPESISFDDVDEAEGTAASTAEPASTGAPTGTDDLAPDELAEGGFTSAAATVERGVDPEALRAELDALEAVLEDQRAVIEAQEERLAALRALIPDR